MRMIPLCSLGINGPQFSKLIRSHGLLSLNGLEHGGLISWIAVPMPSSTRFLTLPATLNRGIIGITVQSAGFLVGGSVFKFGSGFVKIHVGGEEVVLWSQIFEGDGGAIEGARLEIEVVGDSELTLGLGTAVIGAARGKGLVGKRHRWGGEWPGHASSDGFKGTCTSTSTSCCLFTRSHTVSPSPSLVFLLAFSVTFTREDAGNKGHLTTPFHMDNVLFIRGMSVWLKF